MLGILLMIGFTATAPVMDAFAKLAAPTIPVGQIAAARFVLQAIILWPLVLWLGLTAPPLRGDRALYFVRALLILIATSAFFAALRVMPIADAIAIFFVEPFILSLLGAVFLGETIGWRRIAACAVGFAGALLVIRPSFSAFGAVAMLPVLTAFCFACYLVLTRHIARRIPAVALQFWTAMAATVIILPLLAIGHTLPLPGFFDDAPFHPLQVVLPQGKVWIWLAGVGGMAAVSHLMISFALRHTPAGTLAPLQYLEIVAATALGFAIFGDFPDVQTLAGIALIIGSGIYVFVRERRLEREPLPAPQPPI